MIKAVRSMSLLVPLLFASAACGSPDPVAPAGPMATFGPTSTQSGPTLTTGTPTNVRDALEKQWGELAGMGCEDPAHCDVLFALDDPTNATGCMDQLPSENGRLSAFPVTVKTSEKFDAADYGTLLRSFDFVAIRANGVTTSNLMTDATLNCAESDAALPANPVRSSKYQGFVVLDLPLDTTSIGYVPFSDQGGWEWKIGGIA